MHFSVSSATSSGVVGIDNFYTFNWLPRLPTFHDVPARNLVLRGKNFRSINPSEANPEEANVLTGAYHPFGEPSRPNEIVKGRMLANSVLYQANSDGTDLSVYLDGFRNVCGINFSPEGRLFFTELGFDARGSRPIRGLEAMWEGVEGVWYGFPDYSAGIPVTRSRFNAEGQPQPEFILQQHRPLPAQPTAVFSHGSSPMKFDFSTGRKFGFSGWAFVPPFWTLYPC